MGKESVKEKGNFISQNPLGAPIGQDVKYCDKNSEKKENNDNKYKENSGKKNDDNKKFNSVQYSCKLSFIKQKPTSY